MSGPDMSSEDQRIDMGAMLGALLSRWVRILFVTVLALAVTFAVLMFVPKLYESTAGLLVEQRQNAVTAGTQPASQQTSIPVEAMMSSQIELIRSRDTLMSVVESENLRSEEEFTGTGFSPISFVLQLIGRGPQQRSVDETVLANLNERLSVVRERDSAVISINVRTENPELSARVANAIAAAHVRRRTDLSLSDTAEASQWLEQEIARLRVKVQEAEDAVANYRVDNDLFTGSDNTSILNQQLTAISTQITAAQERKNAALSRSSLIREMLAAGQPIENVQDVRDSVVVQQLSETKANLQGELAQRSTTLLGNHPTIRALRAQIAEIEGQITAEARRVATALEAQAKIEGDLEQKLRDDLARAKLSVSTATKDNVTLESLQREAKAQRDLLESYLLRYSDASSRATAGSALPDVRQITFAAPSIVPASPKTTLILGAVGFVALALQIGGILFGELMSGRALTNLQPLRREQDADEDDIYVVEEPEAVAEEDLEAVAEEPDAIGDLFDFDEPANEDFPEPYAETAEADEYAAQYEGEPEYDAEHEYEDDDGMMEPVAEEPDFDEPEPVVEDEPMQAVAERMVPPQPFEPAEAPAAPPRPLRQMKPDPAVGNNALELSNLSADIAIGRVRVVLLAALTDNRDCDRVAETLIRDALRGGLSVVRVDGGSGRMSQAPGLSDLAADLVSFGDVVHRVRDNLAEVPWGQLSTIERRSMRPTTLIEALTDIYEVVIVTTGRIGMASALPIFAGVQGRLVLVSATRPDRAAIEAAVEDAANLGFEVGQIVHPMHTETEVA